MIKTYIKMRVTPEQSEAVQKICKEKGIKFLGGVESYDIYKTGFLYIINKSLAWDYKTSEIFFNTSTFTEVDADLFILTNGTCEEQKDYPSKLLDEANNNIDGKRKQIGGDHYAKHTIQPWDIIREYELDYFEGNALKYLLRQKGSRLEDLRKAAHYLEECIKNEQKRIENE